MNKQEAISILDSAIESVVFNRTDAVASLVDNGDDYEADLLLSRIEDLKAAVILREVWKFTRDSKLFSLKGLFEQYPLLNSYPFYNRMKPVKPEKLIAAYYGEQSPILN